MLKYASRNLFKSGFMRILMFITMSAAFAFGYMDQYADYNFERLHIFLFNLCTGGTVILYLTANRALAGIRTISFYVLSLAMAFSAFFGFYLPALTAAVFLFILTESLRIKTYSFFPYNFFKTSACISDRFHHASLLCLSIALLLSSLVIANDQYLHLFKIEKLSLDVFFLGFSFPVSLITFAVIFSFIEEYAKNNSCWLETYSFWSINLGVIIFFVFILMEIKFLEVITAGILFTTVLILSVFFFRHGLPVQQKLFLVSGMGFLIITAFTGTAYIFMKQYGCTDEGGKLLLRIHSYLSLYGWNLCGLIVISRWNDFPLALNSKGTIFLHWLLILLIAPLATIYGELALPAVIMYIILIWVYLFKKRIGRK